MSLKSKLSQVFKKRETLSVDVDGEPVDLGVPADLLTDLGATVWLAVMSNMAREQGRVETADQTSALMLAFIGKMTDEMAALEQDKPGGGAVFWEGMKWIAPALGLEIKQGGELKGVHPVFRPRLRKHAGGRTGKSR